MLKEPSGGEFDSAGISRPMRNVGCGEAEGGGDVIQRRCGDDGIFEEGAGAAAVGLALDEEHAFAVTNLPNGVVDLDGGWSCLSGEMALQVGIGEVGGGSGVEAEGDGGDDVSVAVGAVEDTATIGEAALLASEGDEGVRGPVEGPDVEDGVGYLLTIGTYVLDGCAANAAGDTGETFNSAGSQLADVEDEAVPIGACGHGVIDGVSVRGGLRRGADRDMEDEAVEAAIPDEEVAAATQDEEVQIAPTGVGNGFDEAGFAGYLGEEASRAADAEGGVGREEDLFVDTDGGRLHGLESTTTASPGGVVKG